MRLEYRVKEKKEEAPPKEADSGKAKADDVVQISEVKVFVQDKGKGPRHLLRSQLWPMIMRPVAAGLQISTINLGGVS